MAKQYKKPQLKRIKIMAIKNLIVFLTLVVFGILPKLATAQHLSGKTYLYLYTTKMPEFKEGPNGLNSFVKSHLKWPKEGHDFQGTVILSFVISNDGSVCDIQVVKSFTKKFDDAAKMLVSQMPKWIPGELNGHVVNVKMYFPFEFYLEN